jgi:hypothetical protein
MLSGQLYIGRVGEVLYNFCRLFPDAGHSFQTRCSLRAKRHQHLDEPGQQLSVLLFLADAPLQPIGELQVFDGFRVYNLLKNTRHACGA